MIGVDWRRNGRTATSVGPRWRANGRSACSDVPSALALTARVEQDLQVVAGVAVELGEDLVQVDVGQRLRDRDRPAVLLPRDGGRARVELQDHVLEPGLGP